MRIGPRELLFFLMLLAMLASTYFFVFEPRNAQIAQMSREAAERQAKLQQLETATLKFADMGKEIDKLSEAIAVFEQRLPAEREVEVILKQIWELAARHRLTPKSVRTDKPVPSAAYTELPIRVVIVGDFDGFYSFLLDLGALRRITHMPDMRIKKVPNEEGLMEADVVLKVFFDTQNPSEKSGEAGKGRM